MYAVFETGGQQFKAQVGDLLKVEKLEGAVGDTVEIDAVLMLRTDDGVKIGSPHVAGAKVIGEIVEQGRAKKVLVVKHRRRKGYEKKQGHRQLFTALKIARIVG
jgi:large subunit ribosomal protein L21